MTRSLIVGALSYALLGCTIAAPSNIAVTTPTYDTTPDYSHVVSEPLNSLLPPPKIQNLELPEGSKQIGELEQHLDNLNEYREYIDRSIASVAELLENDAEVVKETIGTKELVDCSIGPIESLPTDDAPVPQPLPENASDEEMALVAARYADELDTHRVKMLNTVNAWVNKYNKKCGTGHTDK